MRNRISILLLLLLHVVHSSCSIQFVLLVDDSERDSDLIETVEAVVSRINNDDTLLADEMLYFSTVQSMVSIIIYYIRIL